MQYFNSSILACQVIIAVVTVVTAGLDKVSGRFAVFHDRNFFSMLARVIVVVFDIENHHRILPNLHKTIIRIQSL
jgi:hypothetical protein